MPLTRDAYRNLIQEDLAWLESVPRTLERDHVIAIVNASEDHEYGSQSSTEELTETKRKLAAAEAECSLAHSQRRNEAFRADNTERKLSQTEFKLAMAEARVKELEGLSFWWDGENNDSPRVLINKDDTNANARTLGEAMPRKEQPR